MAFIGTGPVLFLGTSPPSATQTAFVPRIPKQTVCLPMLESPRQSALRLRGERAQRQASKPARRQPVRRRRVVSKQAPAWHHAGRMPDLQPLHCTRCRHPGKNPNQSQQFCDQRSQRSPVRMPVGRSPRLYLYMTDLVLRHPRHRPSFFLTSLR